MANKVKTTTTTPANNASLPKGWRIVRFDELAQMVNERVDPSATDADIYVGLEHLDPDSLKLRRWGTPSDVIGDKLQFRKGDIIFGRRRAYQRKLAVAEFDGICSAHAMVVRANAETVDPEFLPFLMQSDLFMQRAIDISVGSLSPTINWKTLRIQEFPLPPKDEQRRIADILWAADEAIEKWGAVLYSVDSLIDVYRSRLFESQKWPKIPLGELFEIKLGKMLSPKSKQGVSPRPYLGNHNVQWGRVTVDNMQFMDFEGDELTKFRLRKGDLLVCEGGEVGRAAIWNDELSECYYQKAIHRLRPIDERAIPEHVLQFFFYAAKRGLFSGLTGHSTIAHLTAVKLRTLMVTLPPKSIQQAYITELNALIKQRSCITSHMLACRQVKATLIVDSIGDYDVH